MALKTLIKDAQGKGFTAGVTSRNALRVSLVNSPSSEISTDELTIFKAFRSFLTESGGASDMNVDGSVTPVEFSLVAIEGVTRFCTGVRFLFNGVNLEMDTNDFRRFGSATSVGAPLPNGVLFSIEQGGITTQFFETPIVRMGNFFDFSDAFLNLPNSITTTEDFLRFDFDFDQPVVLPPDTVDRISVTVADDLSPLSLFKVIARGYQEVI